jgi:hypothetical protein
VGNYVRSVRALGAELRELAAQPAPARAQPAEASAGVPAAAPQPVAVVGVHGISPIQQYGFQDQLATGLLAYLNARDDVRLGVEYVERRCRTQPRAEGDRRSGRDRRVTTAPRAQGDRRRAKTRWAATPYWPRVSHRSDDPVLKPSALRLHLKNEADYTKPATQVYDVFEGYWSPLSKGKTQIVSLLVWLLRVTFLATSSTARIPATWAKLWWDLGYVFGALALVIAFFAGAVFTGANAWTRFIALFPQVVPPGSAPLSFWDFLAHPFTVLGDLPGYAWAHFIVIVVLAYFAVQLVQLAWGRWQGRRRKAELLEDSGGEGHFRAETIAAQKFHAVLTTVFIIAFVLLAIVDAVILVTYHPASPGEVAWESVLLLITFGLIQLGRWLANFVVENILGDVQIYTTHDSNSTFYAIRQQIIAIVTSALLGAVNAVDMKLDADGEPVVNRDDKGNVIPDPPLYRNIHVAGHSLGSTIAMDVLLRIRQLSYEGAVSEEAWGRVRSLTTFGTALEKTRFLLDVRNPTVSASQQQWQNDAYGRFFTRKRSTLRYPDNTNGIFWANHWYAHDIVANAIVSYKSVVKPGTMSFGWTHQSHHEHAICRNDLIPHPRWFGAFVHGDYLGDPLFWQGAGPVLTS